MTLRTRRESIIFDRPFFLKSAARTVPPGTYEVVSDDELIEGLSFPSYRRVATAIIVPSAPPLPRSMEMVSTDAMELADAQRSDGT